MERMDNPPNTLLRPPTELASHLHGLGYRRTTVGGTCWGEYVSFVREEVVRVLPMPILSTASDSGILKDAPARQTSHDSMAGSRG